jgi:hypothetical protein
MRAGVFGVATSTEDSGARLENQKQRQTRGYDAEARARACVCASLTTTLSSSGTTPFDVVWNKF